MPGAFVAMHMTLNHVRIAPLHKDNDRYIRPRTKSTQARSVGFRLQPDHDASKAATTAQSVQPPIPQRLPDSTFDFNKSVDGVSLRIEPLDFGSDAAPSQPLAGNEGPSKEGSENLYARLSEQCLSPPETRHIQGFQSIYLGESWLLTYVVQKVINADAASDISGSSPSSLQVPLPATVGDKPDNFGYDTRLDAEEMEVLNIRGAFVLPERRVSDKLIQTFFECVYPAFPIFDREHFAQLYESNQLSLLILHSIYAVSSTMCEEDVIAESGFESRNAARKVFLKRAKALHDADYETNKVTLVQATFLLSFLWKGATDEKDMFYWLSIAIGNAQGKGMHRTTKDSTLTPRDRRLWKRIWWSLYVRDRHCSGNIGRPMRIRDDDNDVEPLDESDFEDDIAQNPTLSTLYGRSSRVHILFAIAMSKLSVICPSRQRLSCEELGFQLLEWRQQLSPELQDGDGEEDGGFWPKMLDLSYNHHLILLHRPENSKIVVDKKLLQSPAYTATRRITAIADDFLALGLLRKSQLQICPTLFSALTMYVLMARSPDSMHRKLAEHKARLLLLACAEVAKTWPACDWIMKLFETIFKNMEKRSQTQVPQPALGDPYQSGSGPTQQATTIRAGQGIHRESQHEQASLNNYQDQRVSSPSANMLDAGVLADMPLHHQFLNVPEFCDQDLLSVLPLDFGLPHDVLPYMMES
ncbi:hypothetical protein AYO20_07652 [Fonsecaea nubica]|uniref:Xylanolytic transcriptional activator regulatory domain-containing protein n=1 Tax=Fonsecaea nubica TaxID=856822 RepID=A0A178CVE0_9EURO|nr:hypothetical protein AYO20_07652 [Fonsecaea nubica]OAL32861.1 hypothetical protein AYO20_07652 [Fonsecaea nubica]